MQTTLTSEKTREVSARLGAANREFAARYPGESFRRQPVHTVYGGAHLFKSDTTPRLGALALRALETYAPNFAVFARALQLPGHEELPDSVADDSAVRAAVERDEAGFRREHPGVWLAHKTYARVVEKLRREPVEDFRIDFEDGYGNRADAEEDGHAASAAAEVARGMEAGTLPPFIGIRIKPFTEELYARSSRTLDIFISSLLAEAGGRLPENFVVTLPKVTIPEQVSALADLFDLFEQESGLAAGSLKLELMVETTQSIIDHRGRCALPSFVEAARGRCTAAHFGTYDYTASCQITAAHQHMTHPACDYARHAMQVSLGGTGVWLSDGATNIMPVPVHRASEGGALTEEQEEENRRAVGRAWRLHYEHIQHSLTNAFYQGWDLHPAQLPTRYAAVYTFFLESLGPASERLSNFVEKAARATLVGDVFDDAATGQGLLNYFLRATNCGAITEEEAVRLSGLTVEELRSGSFVKILKNRRHI
ncbi:MAG: phosphoenolpyruvate kinase [Acidobacteria bacterium]|nr:phosphoenolpyruvate kinase [Acidobacteriota bacterium]